MSVCKTVMPPYCHIDTGSGTVHLLILKELIGKYRHHLRKEQGLKPNQFHKHYYMLLKDRNDNLIIKGGYSDFSHLTELKNIFITEIYMKKQYKSSKIKNKRITKKNCFDGGSLKRLHSLLSYF